MPTKVTVFGQDEPKQKELKKIEFVKCLNSDGSTEIAAPASEWINIMLLKRSTPYDIMLAWDKEPSKCYIYLGHFNDGVI